MFNLIILEDEAINRHLIKQLINEYVPDINIVAECTAVREAYNEIQKYKEPVIIILDIELNADESGFDLIELIRNRNDSIIVVSAFPEYAIKAFRLDVIDFVPKPIRIKELVSAFERVKTKFGRNKILIDVPTIGIQLFNKTIFVEETSIDLIQSNLSGTKVYLNSGTIFNSIERIGQLEVRLNNQTFFRIDKSNIVRSGFINDYIINDSSQLILISKKGEEIFVSRRRKSEVLKKIKEVLG